METGSFSLKHLPTGTTDSHDDAFNTVYTSNGPGIHKVQQNMCYKLHVIYATGLCYRDIERRRMIILCVLLIILSVLFFYYLTNENIFIPSFYCCKIYVIACAIIYPVFKRSDFL